MKMKNTRSRAASMLAAAGLAALSALPSAAQDRPADLDPADCSNGTFVSDPSANPGLAADCRALAAARNHWTAAPDNAGLPAGHPLLTWGQDGAGITSWTGITVTGQRVTALDLGESGLGGAIPPELGRLTALVQLDLSGNQLTGPLPPEIGGLTSLELLVLEDNQLTALPPEFGGLINLTRFYLEDNRLTALPAEISRLANLKRFDADGNQLTELPPWVGRLTNLTGIDLDGNQLTNLPAQIGQLTNLRNLHLDGNQLTSLPPEIGQLTNLEILSLSRNQLTSLPPQLSQLTNLEWLYLDGNQLTEPIPPELENRLRPEFDDDDNSVHEWAIEQIARWGITLGCGNGRFCPGDSITRSQMAAFLHRAVTHRSGQEPAPASEVTLNDVDEDAWYQRYAEWAVGTGVMRAPDGRFDPGGEVTRADMAEMLAAAFDHITPPAQAQGIFTDMTSQPDRVVRAAEALRTAEVTTGCADNPLRYCPGQPVTRAQMASFFHRALS